MPKQITITEAACLVPEPTLTQSMLTVLSPSPSAATKPSAN